MYPILSKLSSFQEASSSSSSKKTSVLDKNRRISYLAWTSNTNKGVMKIVVVDAMSLSVSEPTFLR